MKIPLQKNADLQIIACEVYFKFLQTITGYRVLFWKYMLNLNSKKEINCTEIR